MVRVYLFITLYSQKNLHFQVVFAYHRGTGNGNRVGQVVLSFGKARVEKVLLMLEVCCCDTGGW